MVVVVGFNDSAHISKMSEWVAPGDTAISGITSLKDGDIQHSSALALSPERDIEPQPSVRN